MGGGDEREYIIFSFCRSGRVRKVQFADKNDKNDRHKLVCVRAGARVRSILLDIFFCRSVGIS